MIESPTLRGVFPLRGALHGRQKNLIAVRVLDRGHGGGVWKSVKLVAEK